MQYILAADGMTPILCEDPYVWGKWMEDVDRHVAMTHIPERKVRVSTVFLGLDYSFEGETETAPALWESMVFPDNSDSELEQRRYTSYAEAIKGHNEIVSRLKME